MKIPKKLQSTISKESLLIVAGKEYGKIFEYSSPELKLTKEIKPVLQTNQDHEGLVVRSGNSETYGFGKLKKDNEVIKKRNSFYKALSKELRKLKGKYKNIYLFIPQYYLQEFKKHIPQIVDSKITQTHLGNYTKEHPIVLIQKINQSY